MSYHFARSIITDVLVVHRRNFQTEEEAETWNKQTGICQNFDLLSLDEVQTWTDRVIWVPLQEEKK